MGEHKYSVLDVVEANETTPSSSDNHQQREPTIEAVATPVDTMEDVPNLVTTNPASSESVVLNESNPKMAASVASGLLGCLVGGPIVGVAVGFGAAYAHDRPGAVGDASRAVGDLACLASVRAQEMNRKHKVAANTKAAAQQMLNRAQQECHHGDNVVEQAQNVLVRGWNWTKDFVHRHNLIERGVQNVGKGVVWVAETIASKINAIAEKHPHHGENHVHHAEARVEPFEGTK
ncbi:hypothetical protein MPSEU_000831600 [Mayamaea pseudoterrestris]|nr:hypothetical protein MPSEU_000831600 [Mayamaea pseudoterrestris]